VDAIARERASAREKARRGARSTHPRVAVAVVVASSRRSFVRAVVARDASSD